VKLLVVHSAAVNMVAVLWAKPWAAWAAKEAWATQDQEIQVMDQVMVVENLNFYF
jgi:hypothetical protein